MATRKSSTAGGATRVSVAATAMIALRKMSLISELDVIGIAELEPRSIARMQNFTCENITHFSHERRLSRRLSQL